VIEIVKDKYVFHRFMHNRRAMNKAKRYYLVAVFLLIFHSAAFANSNTALKILSAARSQIGQGELYANNRGPAVQRYLQRKDALPWCAGFVSYCLQRSGISFRYTLRAKDFLSYGSRVHSALPGDIVIFTRSGGGHVGIVEQVFKDYYISIEGNVGDYPARVKRIKHKYNEKSFLAFVRL
jgi:uncharacterized protein (TIGR02594 family)